MSIKVKLISHRMDIAFISFVIILLTLAPAVFLDDNRWTIIPFLLTLLLISWLVYSAIVKKKLLSNGTITQANIDFIYNFMWDFKPNSQVKFILAAYGMTIGIIILLNIMLLLISPELPVDISLSPPGFIFYCGLFIVSYFIVKKRLK